MAFGFGEFTSILKKRFNQLNKIYFILSQKKLYFQGFVKDKGRHWRPF